MGECSPSICAPNEPEMTMDLNAYAYQFGEDLHQPITDHKDQLTSRAPQCQEHLQHCMLTLKDTGRLFKDPQMSTKPVILRSLNGEDELRCTFERPRIFLNDPSDTTKGRSRMYKIVDVTDSSASQIIIRGTFDEYSDQVMQPFGALLCFLANNPALINNIIMTDSNSYGVAVVKMNVGSRKQLIYIDDYILCADRIPLFSQAVKEMYMWTCLLEKAWFKVNGHIEQRIQKCQPQDIIRTYLNYPLTRYNFRQNNYEYNRKLLQQVLYESQQQKGYILTSKAAPLHQIGLSGKKYFYLLKVLEYQQNKIYYLRNPCPNFDFRGAYRIIPQVLENLIKKQTNDIKIHQGNFVLQQSELLEQIESITVVEFSKQAQEVTQEFISLVVNEQNFIMIQLKADSLVSLQFIQHEYGSKDLSALPLSYMIIDLKQNRLVSDNEAEATLGYKNLNLFRNIHKYLRSGQYLIRLKKRVLNRKNLDKYDKADKIVVTAQHKVKFDYKQMGLFDQHFRNFLKSTGKAALERMMVQKPEQMTNSGAQFVDFWIGELAILYFQNTSRTKRQVRVQVKFQGIQNLQCLTHKIKSEYMALEPISQYQLMIFEKIDFGKNASLGKFIMDTY